MNLEKTLHVLDHKGKGTKNFSFSLFDSNIGIRKEDLELVAKGDVVEEGTGENNISLGVVITSLIPTYRDILKKTPLRYFKEENY